jgi:hypothetical protein
MAIQIIDGFQVNIASPIDNRIVASGSAARNAIPYKYEGLRVFDTFDSVPYVYVNGAWQSENAAGISGAGNASYIPTYTSSNVIGNSIIYQSGSNIGFSTTAPTAKVDVNGTVKATAITTANGSGIAGILGSNINNGTIEVEGSNSKIINGSTGQVLISGVTNTRWLNQNLLVSGTASSSIFSLINNTSATNATHYLAFVSGGAWTSTTAATSSIRASSSDLSYNPSTKILNATRINYSGGLLPTTAGSKLTFLNLTSTTSLNTSSLEINNVRNTTGVGGDWINTGYRIQSKVDDQYLGYIQFNGLGNDAGISFGTGYQSTDSTSNTNERLRISSAGNVLIKNLGSVANPSISFIDDSNTGIYRPVADALALVTGGVERFRVRAGAASDFEFKSLTGARTLGLSVYDSGYTTLTLSSSAATTFVISGYSGVVINGSLSKLSGSFRIEHPLDSKKSTHDLVHSFIEGPRADNIYRGKVTLDNGSATINLDIESNMTEGTFILLNREVQCFTTNETGWTAVKGRVTDNILQINSETTCSDEISWMVIGERHDKHMYDTEWTDDNGKVIVEPLKKLKEEEI